MPITHNGWRAPPPPAKIITEHPLAPDLGAWLFNIGYGYLVPDLSPWENHAIFTTTKSKMDWRAKADSEGGGYTLRWLADANIGDHPTCNTIFNNFTLPVTVTSVFKCPVAAAAIHGIFNTNPILGSYCGIFSFIGTDLSVNTNVGDGSGVKNSDRYSRVSAAVLTVGKMYVITQVYTAWNDHNIYINGTLSNGATIGTGASMGFNAGQATGFNFGCSSHDQGREFLGDIHAVWLHHRALTAKEVAAQAADPYAPFASVGSNPLIGDSGTSSVARLINAGIF